MTEYLTDDEQVELLKSWIKQYSLVILAGMALALISVTGWRYWQQRQYRITSHASAIYDEMLTLRAQNDAESTAVQATKLMTHYPKEIYSQMAAMMLARDYAYKHDYQSAEKQLNWVIDKSKVASFRQIARLRLARVFLADKQPEKAVSTLKKVDDKDFSGLTKEIEGDAYLAMQKPGEAREAYKQALANLPDAEVTRPILKMKYDNLATSVSHS